MANKAISELPQALNVNNQDLFVLEQSGIAKKLTAETFITEQGIIDALAEALDGHGGIQSVTLSSVSGRIRTYLITFTDGSATTFQVYDGTTIERIAKTSTAGLVDTYTVFMNDGTTTFFTVTNGADGTVSEAMLNDALKDKAPAVTETTESSAIATFTDGADDMVMHNVVAEINPVQSGSGDPSPDNIRPITGWTGCNVMRAGKNLFDIAERSKNQTTVTGAASSGYTLTNDILSISKDLSYYGRVMLSAMRMKSGTYTLSFTVSKSGSGKIFYSVRNMSSNEDIISVTGTTTASITQTFTVTSDASIAISIQPESSAVGTISITDIQIELGSTATAYEPYQGETVTVDWTTEAGTVYGGTIDVATGLLTVDRAYIDAKGKSFVGGWSLGEQFVVLGLPINIKADLTNYVLKSKTSMRVISASGAMWRCWLQNRSQIGMTFNRDVLIEYGYDGSTQESARNAAVAFENSMADGSDAVVYPITPITYQLTPQQLNTLLGTNNVWADTGDTSVTYAADTKMFIEKLTIPTEDDLVANQAITSGKYFMIGNSLYLALANIASGAQITIGTNAQRVSLADALNTINS